MQEGLYLIIGEQRRFCFCSTGEIHYVHNMRTDVLFADHILLLEVVHPRTTAFTLAWMEVCVIYRQEFTLSVKHLVCSHFWVIYLDILVLLEGYTIQAFSQTEYTFYHILLLEVWTEQVIRDGILLFFQLLRIETPIPWLKTCIKTFAFSKLLQLCHLLLCYWHVTFAQLIEEVHHVLLVFSAGLGERFISMASLFKELCQRKASIHNVNDYLCVIKITTDSAAIVCGVNLTAQVAVLAVFHHWQISRWLQVEQPSFQTFLLCIGFQHRFGILVQTYQVCLVSHEHSPCVGSFQYVLSISQC